MINISQYDIVVVKFPFASSLIYKYKKFKKNDK